MKVIEFIFVGLIVLAIVGLVSTLVAGLYEVLFTEPDCVSYYHVLKGVNGVSDNNDGLLSSGDTDKTTFLMQDGTIYIINSRMDKLKLGDTIEVKECTTKVFETKFNKVCVDGGCYS